MDKESEMENSLYTEIVKNLSSLMSDVKLENDEVSENARSKSIETSDDKQATISSHANQRIKHEKAQLEYQQQNYAYMRQLQGWTLQNPQMQYMNVYAYIQQLNAINQLYLQQIHQQLNNACCIWSGPLPIKFDADAVYSKKVFIGGLPWNFDDNDVKIMLHDFGPVKVEWPMDENHHKIKGYAYIIFESEQKVSSLLDACKMNGNHYKNNSYFFKIENSGKCKLIELIPWRVSDACYINCSKQSLDSSKTAFIGGIHGKLTADALSKVLNDLFGGVAFIGIDVDEHSYPKGAGRVIFNNQNSYMRAVAAKFIEIKSGKIQKYIQIDPFVQDSLCSSCGFQRGKFFCRDANCFCYFCCQCWNIRHSLNINFKGHTPLTRNSNDQQNAPKNMNIVGINKNPIKPIVKSNESSETQKVKINKSAKKSAWIRKTKK